MTGPQIRVILGPQVPVERGTTCRWLWNMWLLTVFWGFIGKESQICVVETSAFGSDLSQVWNGWKLQCLQDFILVSVTSPPLGWLILFPPLHRGLWPSEHLPKMCQAVNELYLRLALKATAYVSANCRTCQHNHLEAFSLLEPLSALCSFCELPDQQW